MQAIYDAFVRIWEAEGWDGVTTRAVALETGIAVGTLYDYFPDKEALLSGYVRHCVEALLARLDADVVAPPAAALAARERIARLVRITCDSRLDGLPAFDHGMLLLEHRVAEPEHHLRVYDELATRWLQAFAACELPDPPTDATVHALSTAAWGGGAIAFCGAWAAARSTMRRGSPRWTNRVAQRGRAAELTFARRKKATRRVASCIEQTG